MTEHTEERPLVTFALFAYNQERFIREAVEGALAQTYSPLQVILSDDCSSDRTFEIMQEMVAEYSGPHEILLNRNERNLGVGEHINQIMRVVTGELIIAAAGDDISIADRAKIIVEQWLKNNKPSALCSGFICINESGNLIIDGYGWFSEFAQNSSDKKINLLLRFVRTQKPALIGCSEAWTRNIFDKFGLLERELWFEDNAISLRAWLLNGIYFLPNRLVNYRQHTTNICNRTFVVDRSISGFRKLENNQQEKSKRWVSLLLGYNKDIETALKIGLIDESLAIKLSSEINRQIKLNLVLGNWWSVAIPKRIYWYFSCLLKQENRGYRIWGLFRLVPYEVFLSVRSLLSRTRGWSRDLVKVIQSWKGGQSQNAQ